MLVMRIVTIYSAVKTMLLTGPKCMAVSDILKTELFDSVFSEREQFSYSHTTVCL